MAAAVCLKKERQCKEEWLWWSDYYSVAAISLGWAEWSAIGKRRYSLNDFACRPTSAEIMVKFRI